MKKIKFKLIKLEKSLAFQIIEQEGFKLGIFGDDGYRCKLQNIKTEIASSSYPALSNVMGMFYIYIRGNHGDKDKQVHISHYQSNYLRDFYYNLVLESFKLMSEYEKDKV